MLNDAEANKKIELNIVEFMDRRFENTVTIVRRRIMRRTVKH
jgi:hypothetical protein